MDLFDAKKTESDLQELASWLDAEYQRTLPLIKQWIAEDKGKLEELLRTMPPINLDALVRN